MTTQIKTASDLEDIFIVIDANPRFRCVLLVTRDLEEAEEFCRGVSDFVILQPSGKDRESDFRDWVGD